MDELNKEDKKIIRTINAKFKKAISDYRLIEDNDHILIGLSGGKDSLALVELLGERMKIFVPRFRLTAAHISVENIPYQSDLDYLRSHCKNRALILFITLPVSMQRPIPESRHAFFVHGTGEKRF